MNTLSLLFFKMMTKGKKSIVVFLYWFFKAKKCLKISSKSHGGLCGKNS